MNPPRRNSRRRIVCASPRLADIRRHEPDRAETNPCDPVASDQVLPAHFFNTASHCCAAHLTESSALSEPVAAFAIMSGMVKLL
jgi:hypothetical protein